MQKMNRIVKYVETSTALLGDLYLIYLINMIRCVRRMLGVREIGVCRPHTKSTL